MMHLTNDSRYHLSVYRELSFLYKKLYIVHNIVMLIITDKN